jgi:hypothetical protein
MLLEQYSFIVFTATYLTYALTLGFVGILSSKAYLPKTA